MKMDALVKKVPEKGLWLERVEMPTPQEGEALIKIHKTAICGTDVHIYNWDEWSQNTIKTPMVIGHEYVGEIVEINGKTDAFKVGDIVSGEGHIVCGKCHNCRKGVRHLCPNTQGIGVNRAGIFGEYAVIPLSNLWLCEKDIPEEMYAIFDPLGNAIHTALSYNVVGDDVLITGAGPIGIMAAAIVKFIGARKVVLTNTSDWRLDFAKKLIPGLVTVNTKNENLKDVQKRIGIKEGFDVGLEMSGSGIALGEMIDNMINGGRIALLGLLKPGLGVDWNKIIWNCLNIKGIYGREIFGTWQKMTALLQAGLDISGIITHRLDYTEFEQGFELMNGKKCGKIILNWDK
jgi:threonine 3-dehydrogenase